VEEQSIGESKGALDSRPDDERQEWRQLWEDVAALLKKVEEKK